MSALGIVAVLEASVNGRAVPLTTVRHAHVAERPLVLIPLVLAGEACAPIAALLGSDRDRPELLIVPRPKNRTDRFRFAADLADLLLPYFESFTTTSEIYTAGRSSTREERKRHLDAPQLIVPNPGGSSFLRLLGRSTRYRSTDGPYAVDRSVPRLGQWLTWIGDQSEFPTSSLLLPLTKVLRAHWATGQSPTEDGNLAALLGWIAPPEGMDGYGAALLAEDPARFPPAGPTTDPVFDRTLSELYQRINEATTEQHHALAERQLRHSLLTQLELTWQQMWQSVDLLRALPAGRSVAVRWQADRTAFTAYAAYLADGGLPQARRDHAAGAARRLARLEDANIRYARDRAFDDPLLMAEFELLGEAVTGTITSADATRTLPGKRGTLLRPMITLTVPGPGRLVPGTTVLSPTRPKQNAVVLAVRPLQDGRSEIDLELTNGMGKAKVPAPGSVPSLGELLCYTTLAAFTLPPALPDEASTPWTHGGPPTPYQPTNDDANEAWE
ncbi:hypothetical protein ACEZDB_28055 [Streptacidiphilus sp. N1-3]|uniref:PglZ domain-containing protein n=1 Tax=Streptacidiphilus alkalitolerans TaxID=3342712 RepID=A0ABV6X8G0_9ACTN